jgi:hypothetical protein
MNSYVPRLVVVLGVSLSLVGVVVACGSSDDSQFGNGSSSGGKFDPDGSFGEGGIDGGDLYANDPLPPLCPAPDTAACCASPNPPKDPSVTGTVDCPSDKNKPGCGCTTPGQQAPCWTGLRANRNLGVCKDGVTTCTAINETSYAWGECVGQVLPTAGATKGPAACRCFSAGAWKLANISPCFIKYCNTNDCAPNAGTRTDTSKCQQPAQPGVACDGTTGPCECVDANANNAGSGTNGTWGLSTIMGSGGSSSCPTIASNTPPPALPSSAWTTDTLNVDCAGHFKLCYELKAGDYANPQAGDCSLTKLCVEADYLTQGVEQAFPDLPAWSSPDSACADKWSKSGGYGEMSVVGESVRCDKIDDGAGNSYVFNRVKYCPRKCENGANASAAECQGCQQGGGGTF